jgi:glycine C-acetyltransferase
MNRRDPLAFLSAEFESLETLGLVRRLRVLDGKQRAKTSVDHHVVVNLSSNNYLGLTTHPKLKARASAAIDEFGVGSGSVRTIVTATHSREDLQYALDTFAKVGRKLAIL